MPPPPDPVLPSEFTIQLYNPDQQVTVRHKASGWNSAASWEFEIPQQTFREPSASALDRGQHDPAASEVTPKIVFRWKKDSKFSKDLACFMSGKSTDIVTGKAKNRDPDITVSIFKGLKELTLYEPNLQRVDIEDLKGFEVVLLLGAVVIRDVYFGSLKDTFNIGTSGRKSNPTSPSVGQAGLHSDLPPQSVSPTNPAGSAQHLPIRDPRVPPTDPRSQWEIDAETARLRRQAAEEERTRRRREEDADRQTRLLLEREAKEQYMRQQAAIDQETERLRLLYGQEDASARPYFPPQDPRQQRHHSESTSSAHLQDPPAGYAHSSAGYPPGPYMSGAAASQSSFLSPVNSEPQSLKPKSSLFNFRRRSDHDANKLQTKRSAVF